jgi:hypothetical protein
MTLHQTESSKQLDNIVIYTYFGDIASLALFLDEVVGRLIFKGYLISY